MPRYKLTVAYDGTDFHGWQKQRTAEGIWLRTVQGVLEECVREVVREPVEVCGASRTDSGVHACGQVAAFTTATRIPLGRVRPALNSRLPDDVQVVGAARVPDAFDPIRDALAKAYRYRFAHGISGGARRPLFDRRTVTVVASALDPARMDEAAGRLVGEHDFASFTRKHHGRESTVRTIFRCRVTPSSAHRLRLDVSGDGFLYNMVRIVAGTLVEIGRGRLEPDDVPRILAARDRAAAGPTQSPEGLCLMWVRYE